MADKPAHIIEISDALGRDVDKAKAGKLKHELPVEAFMSEEAISQVAQQSAAAAAPVHAEDLRMITRAEAARRSTFNGETLPGHPVPRRVIPEPFQRPFANLVSVEGPTHGRDWTTCQVELVTEGDMVVDVGRVARAPETEIIRATVAGVHGVPVGMKVILTGITGNRVAFAPGTIVRAFRLAELWAAEDASGSWTSAAERESAQTATPPTSMSPGSTTIRRWASTTPTISSARTRSS